MELDFLNGMYHTKINNILTDDDFNTLRRVGRQRFFRYLKTKDFGRNSTYKSIDEIIERDLYNAKEELDSNAKDNFITDIFFLENDLTNMKIIYKEVETGIKANNFSNLNRFEKDALYEFFKHGNYKLLPKEHEQLFIEINKIPLDYEIQDFLQALEVVTYNYYSDLARSKKVYLGLSKLLEFNKAMSNLRTFLKFRHKGETLEKLKISLLEESFIGIDVFIHIYNKNNLEVVNKLMLYFSANLTNAISEYLTNHNMSELRPALKAFEQNFVKELSYDDKSLGPVLYYLYMKDIQGKKVRELYYEE